MDGEEVNQMTAGYAFPHATAGESRRLHLLAERLDPVTKRRIGQLGLGPAVRCLEIGGGRGSMTGHRHRPGYRVSVTTGAAESDRAPPRRAHR